MNRVTICKEDYATYYQYRKAISEYRDRGWVIARVEGGVVCFAYASDYDVWKNQK